MNLHQQQRDVQAFHYALNIPVGDYGAPSLTRIGLRRDLIIEEANETATALDNGNFVEAIDGLCDLIVVSYGAAVEWGIDIAPFWDEVHKTNLAKAGGPEREDGKRLKPEGWTPPDIRGILAGMGVVQR